MAKKYAFTRERDVRRALKTSRLVLDRRVMQPAQFSRAPSFAGSTSTTTGAANCPCGTQYKRGSQTLTLNSVDYEHATTYTVTATCFDGTWWFPEVTHDTGTWVSGVEELLGCYAGSIDGLFTVEPFYVTIDGVDVLHAWGILTTDANDCTDINSVAGEDVEARWICRNWNPLGPTAQFELMGPTKLGDVDLPKFLCVSPKAPVLITTSDTVCGIPAAGVPDLFYIKIGGSTLSYDYRNPGDIATCAYYSDNAHDCTTSNATAVCGVTAGGSSVTLTFLGQKEFTEATVTYFSTGGAIVITNSDWANFITGALQLPISLSGYATGAGVCTGSTLTSLSGTILVPV